MKIHQYIVLSASLLCYGPAKAQDSLNTRLSYDLSTEAAVGTGSHTAYQLVTNRHHVLSTRSNTAYLRGALNLEQPLNKDWTLSATVDGIASVHADHKTFLQQAFANISYKSFFLEAGMREQEPIIRDGLLSSGSLIKGANAKPIPQVHFGTKGFWTIPYTKGWLQANFDFGYGKILDSDYKEKTFNDAPDNNISYATGTLYHQKHLYFRTNPEKPFFVIAGIEHVAFFGGTIRIYNREGLMTKEKPSKLKDFWNVIIPVGDNNYYENDAFEDWRYGNHIGMMTLQLGWNINKQHQVQAYLDNPFEDGSGIRKGNGWDGLWGIQYTNKSSGKQYLRGAVVEYLQTSNQCGPLHWSSNDYPEPIRSRVTDQVRGNDNYYNHFYYGSYAHYGMTPGNALLASPIYNKDGDLRFKDNRVKAWHVGINGDVTDRLSYLVNGSYREGWGTYTIPLINKHHSFDAMVQGIYNLDAWQFAAAYAFDKGNIYGDCSTFNLIISYHGKIL